MPNPKDYKDQESFISACIPMMIKDKGMENDQAAAACYSMWRNRDKTESNARAPLFSNSFREVEKAGKKFLVVSGIPVREQVMNTYLVPAAEIARSIAGWNDTAISIQHPKSNNGSANVPDPDVAIIGRFYNARWDGNHARMSGEYWIEIDEAMKWKEGETIINSIKAGKILETSTGYYADDDPTPGEFNGRAYKTIHRNLLPDHIAILPNEIGACSIHDGCGINRNVKLNECECDCPFKNESIEDSLNEINAAFAKEFNKLSDGQVLPQPNLWIRKTYDDHVIVIDGFDLYKVNYGRNTEGNPIFAPRDEWQKVELLEQYVETNADIPDYQPDHLPRAMLEGYAFNKGNRTPEQLDALRAHIRENGIDKPCTVMRMDDGEIKILDGNHRVSMAGEFRIDQIPVKVINEQLQPIDPEMMYHEWAHQQDQGYLNQQGEEMDIPEKIKNHPMFSEELYKRMMEKGMSSEEMMGAMDDIKDKQSQQNRESRLPTSATVTKTKKEPTMKLPDFFKFLQGKGIQVKQNSSGEFEVEEPTTLTDQAPALSADEIAALKSLAASAARLNAFDDEALAALKQVKVVANFAKGLEEKEKAERTALVAAIKANGANVYSDEELAAMPQTVLVKLNAQMNTSYAGLVGVSLFTNEDDAPLGIMPVLLNQGKEE